METAAMLTTSHREHMLPSLSALALITRLTSSLSGCSSVRRFFSSFSHLAFGKEITAWPALRREELCSPPEGGISKSKF